MSYHQQQGHSRVMFGRDIGVFMGDMLGLLLKALYGMHVLWADQMYHGCLESLNRACGLAAGCT